MWVCVRVCVWLAVGRDSVFIIRLRRPNYAGMVRRRVVYAELYIAMASLIRKKWVIFFSIKIKLGEWILHITHTKRLYKNNNNIFCSINMCILFYNYLKTNWTSNKNKLSEIQSLKILHINGTFKKQCIFNLNVGSLKLF